MDQKNISLDQGLHLETGILCETMTASDALKQLYQLRKKQNRKYSLQFFCREAGIPSTGYISDVMHGKKTLALKYVKPIVKAFRLKGEHARFLKLMLECDNLPAGPQRRRLERKIGLSRKVLRMSFHQMPSQLQGLFFALEVFCAFSLFKNSPKLAQLEQYFGCDRSEEIKMALSTLEQLRLIGRAGDHFSALASNHVIFSEETTGMSHVDFLKQALSHASEHVAYWFPRKSQSYFSSMVLSVKTEHFEKVLSELKRKMLLTQADLESQDADALIRVNLQVYPLAPLSQP